MVNFNDARSYVSALRDTNPLNTSLSGNGVLADIKDFLQSEAGQFLIEEAKRQKCCVPITRSIHRPVSFPILEQELFQKRAVLGLNNDGELRVLVGWSVGHKDELGNQIPDARGVKWREAIWPSNLMTLHMANVLSKKYSAEELSPQHSIEVWKMRLGLNKDNN